MSYFEYVIIEMIDEIVIDYWIDWIDWYDY